MRRNTYLIGITGCFILGLIYITYGYMVHKEFSDERYFKNDQYIRKIMNHKYYKFSYFDEFKKTVASDFNSKSKYERCEQLLKYIDSQDPKYSFPLSFEYNKDIDKMVNFMNREISRETDRRKKKGIEGELPTSEKKIIKEKFFQEIDHTLKIDQKMIDNISLLRIYNQCFLRNEKDYPINQTLWNNWTGKLYHYLGFELPVFDVYDPNLDMHQQPIRFNNGLPDFSTGRFNGDVRGPETDESGKKTENLLQYYHKSINGKGIVITTTSRHARDVAKLLRVLRALNNELPVQVVYRGHLSDRSRNIILNAALEDFSNLVNSSNFEKVLPEVNIMDPSKFGVLYPPQKISFASVKPIIRDNRMFQNYNNKLISLIFSSFEEIILMDADTVPLVNPQEFFDSEEYSATSSFFFKDRSLRDRNDYLETNYFKKMMPLNDRIDSIDRLLGLPEIDTNSLSKNNYIHGWRHFQEAGVVALNKRKHFGGLMMMLPLAIWREPIKTSVWGDKEFYWLGLLMNGDDQISFNQYEVASVGQVTPDELKVYNEKSNEVCSTHPGHVDRHGKLLWINSGFHFCKKNNHYRDKDKYPFSKIDGNELFKLYENPLKITHALVPPSLPDLRHHNGNDWDITSEIEFIQSWQDRKPDSDEIKDFGQLKEFTTKLDYLPQKGWVKNGICSGYYYCAYDSIESYGRGESTGHLFSFDEETIAKYDYLGKLWSTANPRV